MAAERAESALVARLRARVDPESQSYAALVEGEAMLARRRPHEALERFESAQKLADTWLARFDLGRAYAALGQFPEAYAEFDACTKRRGEALALFLDDTPTLRNWAAMLTEQARAKSGLAATVRPSKP
jgi:tetratricopeptide (TPR) repeat protein